MNAAITELKERATAAELCLIDKVIQITTEHVTSALTEDDRKAATREAWVEVKEALKKAESNIRPGDPYGEREGVRQILLNGFPNWSL